MYFAIAMVVGFYYFQNEGGMKMLDVIPIEEC